MVVRDGERLLLMKRVGDHGGGTWSCPGGHLDPGVEPIDCARREAREEVGIEARDVTFVGVTNDLFPTTGKHYITLWFTGHATPDHARIASPLEVLEIGWFSTDDLVGWRSSVRIADRLGDG